MDQDELVDVVAGLPLFAELKAPQLEAIVQTFETEAFPAGQRILRQGFQGTGFYVILDGEAAVRIDGEDRAKLGKGDFFGEMSILLGEPPVADVVALSPIQALHLSASELDPLLRTYPSVAVRMLRVVARRLRNANRWRS